MDKLNNAYQSDAKLEKPRHLNNFFRGPAEASSWERPILLLLLVLTAVAYIWGLNQLGWSNSFYSAAVQAASKSWKAFFFGSIDAANFITVDKPPAFIWVMALSARIFGLNSWSILVPEALEGVACVWVLYMTVRRWFSPGAALLAGAVLAMTPVAALMFRFNNPDALLVLLLTASAYAFTRALEEGKTKWLVWASVLIGLGFLTKMLAAFFVIPGFVVIYLVFAPVSIGKRIAQILISMVTVLISAGWWVAIVQLIPAADRPYIGSSQKNSILDLIFGYNGLGRLTGNENSMGGHGGNASSHFGNMGSHGGGMFGGQAGLTRLFQSDMGGQIAWLIPAALILLIFSIWLIRRNWRGNRTLTALLMWAATFFVTGIVFSFGHGIIHQYYTIALAPSVGALVGIGVDVLWHRRNEPVAYLGLALAVAVTAVWSFVLLDRTPTWIPWLRVVILIIGLITAVSIAIGPWLGKNLFKAAAAVAVVASLGGPLAYTIQTIATPHTGSMPTAGPSIRGGFSGNFGGGKGRIGFNSFAGVFENNTPGNFTGRNFGGNSNAQNFAGGGFGENATPGKAIIKLLQQNASKYTWVAATIRATSSASYQLTTGDPIMDIGGFLGSDPAPTLSEFKKYVSEGKIHYFISDRTGFGGSFNRMGRNFSNGNTNGEINGNTFGGHLSDGMMGMSGGRNSTTATSITNWVEKNFKSKTVGGVTVYDLTQAKS